MDFHFLIRNGIAGGIFVAFVYTGILIGNPGLAHGYLRVLKDYGSVLATAVALTPVIGICLQGIYLLALYWRGRLFSDYGRHLVANRIRQVINASGRWPEEYKKPLNEYYPDPIFVAFYHSHAPVHLIEWARRRRSYHYLGWTISIAAVLGILIGLFLSKRSFYELIPRFFLLTTLVTFGIIIIAISCCIYLATRMLRDVDQMEAIWALAYLEPEVGVPLKMFSDKKPSEEATKKTAKAMVIETLVGAVGALLLSLLSSRSQKPVAPQRESLSE